MSDSRRGLILINTAPAGQDNRRHGYGPACGGNGMKVLMLQFLKGSWHYGELDAVKAFGESFVLKQMGGICEGGGCGDRSETFAWWSGVGGSARGNLLRRVDMVVLDEINYASGMGC